MAPFALSPRHPGEVESGTRGSLFLHSEHLSESGLTFRCSYSQSPQPISFLRGTDPTEGPSFARHRGRQEGERLETLKRDPVILFKNANKRDERNEKPFSFVTNGDFY